MLFRRIPPVFLFLLLMPLFLLTAWCARAQEAAPLRSTAEIRQLSRAQLASRPRVDFEAVILSVLLGAPPNLQVYQDGTAIYIHAALGVGDPYDKAWLNFQSGDRVRIQGRAKAGNFAPVVIPEKIDKIGSSPLPEPQPITVSDLSSGRLDGQWVTISGVVRNVSERNGFGGLEIGNAQGEFLAKMFSAPPPSLIGSHVRLRGLCLPYFNIRGQMMGLLIHVGGMKNVMVLQPAGEDPFAVPEISAAAMRPFDLEQGTDAGRCRLRGTVIFSVPGSYLYLQADRRGVRIGLAAGQSADVGDLVEISGFVRMRQGFAEMAHSLVRKLGTAEMPEPELLDSASILSPSFYKSVPPPPDVNGRLVALRGILLKTDRNPDGKTTFWVGAPGTSPLNVPVSVPSGTETPRIGSRVELRGVCELIMPEPKPMDGLSIPVGMTLSIAKSSDLKVLKAASWWTPARLWTLVGGIACAFALTLLQVRSLRRRVRIGAIALSEAIVRRRAAEARADERQRLAEEVHDIMAQSLTGVALQLGAADLCLASAPAQVPHHLKLASGLLEFARDEIRRTLLDLRSGLLDKGNLTDALKTMAGMFTKTGTCEVEWDISGIPPRVHPLTAHSLLRVIQETLTNAVKHGHANRIRIQLDYSDNGIALKMMDNGCGTAASLRPGPAEGHFGLEGMRGRVLRLGGNFRFQSAPGEGAKVEIHIPAQPAATVSLALEEVNSK
ncbi:MAG: sensor histidine kinase [Verrucomicrobiota bacterium]